MKSIIFYRTPDFVSCPKGQQERRIALFFNRMFYPRWNARDHVYNYFFTVHRAIFFIRDQRTSIRNATQRSALATLFSCEFFATTNLIRYGTVQNRRTVLLLRTKVLRARNKRKRRVPNRTIQGVGPPRVRSVQSPAIFSYERTITRTRRVTFIVKL